MGSYGKRTPTGLCVTAGKTGQTEDQQKRCCGNAAHHRNQTLRKRLWGRKRLPLGGNKNALLQLLICPEPIQGLFCYFRQSVQTNHRTSSPFNSFPSLARARLSLEETVPGAISRIRAISAISYP